MTAGPRADAGVAAAIWCPSVVGQVPPASALEPVLSALRDTMTPHGFSNAEYRFTGREHGELAPVLEVMSHRHAPFIEFVLMWGFFSLEYLLLAFPGRLPSEPRVELGPFTGLLPNNGMPNVPRWRWDGGQLFEFTPPSSTAMSSIREVVEAVEGVLPIMLGTTRLSELPPIIERLEGEFAAYRNTTWTDDPIAIISPLAP